jgi:hypothetical protein
MPEMDVKNTTFKVYRPHSMRRVNAVLELNRLTKQLSEAEAQLSEVRKLLDYFDECSGSGFVSVTNPYTHCRNLLQAILKEQP